MILRSCDFIVFLDEELSVEWSSHIKEIYISDQFDEVVNRMSNLEITSSLLLTKNQLLPFRRLLGERIARILGSKNTVAANKVLDDAEQFLKDRSEERARVWYITSSLCTTIIALILSLILWLLSDHLRSLFSDDFVQVTIFCLFA